MIPIKYRQRYQDESKAEEKQCKKKKKSHIRFQAGAKQMKTVSFPNQEKFEFY